MWVLKCMQLTLNAPGLEPETRAEPYLGLCSGNHGPDLCHDPCHDLCPDHGHDPSHDPDLCPCCHDPSPFPSLALCNSLLLGKKKGRKLKFTATNISTYILMTGL